MTQKHLATWPESPKRARKKILTHAKDTPRSHTKLLSSPSRDLASLGIIYRARHKHVHNVMSVQLVVTTTMYLVVPVGHARCDVTTCAARAFYSARLHVYSARICVRGTHT